MSEAREMRTAWLVYGSIGSPSFDRLAQAIHAQDREADQMLAVCHPDAVRDEVKRARGLGFDEIVRGGRGWPIGKILNAGVRASNADIVVVVSTCALPLGPHFFSDVIAAFEEHPRVAAVRCLRIEDRPRLQCWMEGDVPVTSLQDVERAVLAGPNVSCFGIRRSAWAESQFNETVELSVDKIWSYFALQRGHSVLASNAMFSDLKTLGLGEAFRRRSRQAVEFHKATGEYVRHVRPSVVSAARGLFLNGPRIGARHALGSVLTFVADVLSHSMVRGAQTKRLAQAQRDGAHV